MTYTGRTLIVSMLASVHETATDRKYNILHDLCIPTNILNHKMLSTRFCEIIDTYVGHPTALVSTLLQLCA